MNFDLDSDAMALAARVLEEEQKRTLHAVVEAHVNNNSRAVRDGLLDLGAAMELAGTFRAGHTADLETEYADSIDLLERLSTSLKGAKSALSKAKAAAKTAAHQKAPTHR